MKKLLTLILATITAHAATNDLVYLQKNSSGKTVERVVTLTPSTFLSVNGSGQLQVQSSSAFLAAIGGATAAQGVKADTALQPGAVATTLNMATARILGRTTAASGAVEELTASQVKTMLAITSSDVSDLSTAVQTVGDARYPQLSGSYADPAWITSLAWSKLTSVPVFLAPTGDGSGLTNLNASALASGTVPDARFPATLPAASGTNLTALNASNLGSGTVPAARLTSANLPNITLTLSGVLHTSPVTISGGSGTASLANQNVNLIFAGPSSGGAAAPTFRSIVPGDLPAATTSAQGASVLASDIEIQTGTDSAKTVRPSGLAAWWIYVKAVAQTFTGNFTAGDAAGDEFVANDDDPRFPNLTAASFSAAGDSKVAINGEVGDARYTWPFRGSHIVVPAATTVLRGSLNSPYAGADTAFLGSGGITGGPMRLNCNTRFQNQLYLLLNQNTDATTALSGTFILPGTTNSNAIPFNKRISMWVRLTSCALSSNATFSYVCGGRLGGNTNPGLGGYGFGIRIKGGATQSALPIYLITANASTITGGISGATNATPIVITSAGHGLSTGNRVHVSAGVAGNTAARGLWTVTVVDADTFSLNNSVGNAAYTSGGSWTKIIDTETACGTINGSVVNEITTTSDGVGNVTLTINGSSSGSATGAPTSASNNYDSWLVSIINDGGTATSSYVDFHRAEMLIYP